MWRRVMQAIQEQWRQVLGISVKLENADWQIHMDRLRRGHYQIARCGRTADFVDSLAFLQALLSFNTGQNFCRWENGEYDKLILSSERVRSLEERRECLEKAERLMMEEMPIAPLMYFTAYSLAREDLKGVVVSPLYYVDFSKAYFDKKT
jgi:oligopeptide transport system substrate-binding protein